VQGQGPKILEQEGNVCETIISQRSPFYGSQEGVLRMLTKPFTSSLFTRNTALFPGFHRALCVVTCLLMVAMCDVLPERSSFFVARWTAIFMTVSFLIHSP
jgi:hypothetical protein